MGRWDAIDGRTTSDVLDVKASNKNSCGSPSGNIDRMTFDNGNNFLITSLLWISRSV